jgi:hypothetical protein
MNPAPRNLRTAFHWMLLASPVFLLTMQPVSAAERITSGKWESTMVTDGDTRTITYCISAAEAASINGDSKSGREFAEKKAGGRCAISAYEIKGATVSYTLVCGTRTITDRTAFHGETSEGTKTVAGEGETVTSTLKSRRVGPC